MACDDGSAHMCDEVLRDVWLFLDDEMDPERRAVVQQHIDDCSPCLEEAGLDAKLKSLLHRKCGGDKAPEQLKVRLLSALREVSTTVTSDGVTTVSTHGAQGTDRARPSNSETTSRTPRAMLAGFCRSATGLRPSGGSGVGPLAVVRAVLPAGLLLAGALTHVPLSVRSATGSSSHACAARPAVLLGRERDWMGPRSCLAVDARPRPAPFRWEGTAMAEEVLAEMVANVWKVLVAEGDPIADGDTLVILESMKMEIPVIAEVDGTVTKVAVVEGQVVQEGDLIAEIS